MGNKNQSDNGWEDKPKRQADEVSPWTDSVSEEMKNRPDEYVGGETVAFENDLDPSMEETGDQADTIDQLVVYLDGQLEADQRQEVETSILQDPELQGRLAALQESWDALETLERPDVGDRFTESTVKFVVTSELKSKKNRPWAKYFRYGLIGVASCFCLLIGYQATQFYRTADQRQFYQDYSLIEKLDLYQGAGDFEFLVQLKDEDFFPQGETDDQ